jgi:hypothetical protein
VLDGLRRDFADHYLREGSASVAEVAERLGFSSTSAFQRWFGKPPIPIERAGRRCDPQLARLRRTERGTHGPRELRMFEARFRRGPTGMILFHPSGGAPVSGSKLALQFTSELLASVLLAYLLSWLAAPPLVRALAPAAMGAFACLSVSALYWNWYGFPTPFFLAQCADKVIGWALAGSALTWLTRATPTASRR